MKLSKVFRAALDLVVPPLCWVCREPARGRLCGHCRQQLPWIEPLVPRRRGSVLQQQWSPLEFEGPARALVHALKFHSATALAALMAEHLVDALPPRAFPDDATLVPVPANARRLRQRGFDHADLLASALARRVRLPLDRPLRRETSVFNGQRGLGRSDRLSGRGLQVTAAGAVPSRAILVDDVCTTGATLERCAKALLGAGAFRVGAVTYCTVP
ncbi:MAG: double zinc ribbon domain-containing protein [Actinomycetes bacterium]